MRTLLKIINDHILYKKQIIKLAKSDIYKTYRGAALGWAWAIIKPVTTIVVFYIAFSIGLRKGAPVNNYPFFLWLIAGMVPWFYMSEMLSAGTECIRNNRHLVTKVRYPVSTIPTFTSLSKLFINVGLIIIVILIFVGFDLFSGDKNIHSIDIYYLQLPLYIFFMFAFFTVFTFFNSLMGAVSKDYVNLVKAFITPIFWLSGILYNPKDIDPGLFKNFLSINPVTYICTGFRNVFIYKKWFFEAGNTSLAFFIVFLLVSLMAIQIYRKIRKDLPDVL